MFVYGEPAGRVIFVRAALISVEEAARISSESVPNGGCGIKEHDGSVSEGWVSYQGHFPVDDRAFEYLPSVKSTSPTTENGYENCIYSMNNINMSDEDNKHDTNYINKHKYTNHDTRKLHL